MTLSDSELPPFRVDREVTPEYSGCAAGLDTLTGLADRAGFQSHLDRTLTEAANDGAEFALIVFDIDCFKQFNHIFGHQRADALLVAVAKRVAGVLRRQDFFARLDGDEFAVLASFPANARIAAQALAERIFATFSESFSIDGRILRADVTIGMAFAPGHAASAANLHRFADLGLHAGKIAGRNRISIFDEQTRYDFEARWIMEERLRSAIAAEEIDVSYQPILDLRTGCVAGVEALARWRHPVLGIVPPAQFIPVAEDNHMIRELDRQILARACHDTRRWIKDGAIDFFSVNLSPVQVEHIQEESGVLSTLSKLAIDPATLVLEITERLMLLDSAAVRRSLEALRAKGIRLALDDFGAGFSNLSYLSRFSIDRIKIDRSLVADIEDKHFTRIIVESVTDLAHRLGLQVIVEGVETIGQRQILTRIGCDYAQGFWFSHALPAAEMDALLRRQAADTV